MILVGSQRSGAIALANHLMNARDNDHVTVLEIDGFMGEDLHEAFQEAQAIAKATKCKQYLFSLSLNPPEDAIASEQDFIDAANRAGRKLGLDGQPRAIVIHEKEGRRHAHVVWSRIDADELKAINLPHFKAKLRDVARDLFLEHGWEMPEGLANYGHRNPLNFTLAEWQQAMRHNTDPREIKAALREAWAQSDDAKSLNAALEERGFYLAKGDRRAAVVLDINGNLYALGRWSGVKAKEVKARLSDLNSLPSVQERQADLKVKMTAQVRDYIESVTGKHVSEMQPFLDRKAELTRHQRDERQQLKAKQEERWRSETKARMDRLNKGLRGLFDRLTGKAKSIRADNQKEALACVRRDQRQRDDLVEAQMKDRKALQIEMLSIKRKQKQERSILARNIRDYLRRQSQDHFPPDHERERRRSRTRGLDLNR
ncbi:Relaxase/Mobilisation nuclease domain-containing protein [Poseidonocella pacifica]|uniref:Relaxase/Mobilisation nuclease domain-containing protein n=1 Tax=Poseidonocella pacifica TaxID=871651 RepID=A0A1I0WJM1_9RHOB|nr:relaxase/mobilization nuclease domain-containing protein [Poseidonocella pacifica]SFA88841.1 Relaxase/Mobilisation nuclease domain-containing protein [Poseidonocella pacifica]